LPRRRRARGQRSRTTERQREASPPPEARPALSTVAREETEEQPQRAPRRVSSSPGAATKTASRHITRDYSYVPGELKQIAITMGIIVAGLVGAAIVLR
jgi:hypothetical protein